MIDLFFSRIMFSRPANFQDFLSRSNHTDEIYKALGKEDLSEIVIAALDVLRKTHQLPTRIPDIKNELISTEHRKKGNIALERGKYQIALMCYNQALLTAPKNSRAMILAISNRSALFLKLKAYKACLKDIDTCFSMDCPSEIIGKLTKRKRDASVLTKENELDVIFTAFARKHTECTPNNSEIPCATSDIKAVGSIIPKIVASNDIKIGTVICCERAYVSYTDPYNSLYSCHFCQKMTLNLIPCEGCSSALFCDEECKSKCFDEYHKYECTIMNLIKDISFGPMPNLMIKAALKMRAKCKSWRELIDASYNMGIERIKSSSIQEIFDVDSIFSVLNQMDDKPFIYGVKYDACFVCASFIHYLDEIPSFFPKDIDGKKQAMCALGRIMMFLSLYIVPWKVDQAVTNLKIQHCDYHEKPNVALFSFIGKLKNSCTPNVAAVYNNNKMSLIALESIKTGEELTISYQ